MVAWKVGLRRYNKVIQQLKRQTALAAATLSRTDVRKQQRITEKLIENMSVIGICREMVKLGLNGIGVCCDFRE